MIINIYQCEAITYKKNIEAFYSVKEYRFSNKSEALAFSIVNGGDIYHDIDTNEYMVYDRDIKDNWSCSRVYRDGK